MDKLYSFYRTQFWTIAKHQQTGSVQSEWNLAIGIGCWCGSLAVNYTGVVMFPPEGSAN